MTKNLWNMLEWKHNNIAKNEKEKKKNLIKKYNKSKQNSQ
jgi:hypothetical protein